MEWYLPVIWAALIGTAVALYVILDGFDLGVGILFPFAKKEEERDQMMNSVAPYWDGNETWLVLGGGGLLGGVSTRLRGDHAGVLPAGDPDAARAGVPRRGVRVSLAGENQPEVLELRVRRRLDAGGVLPRRHPRRTGAGHPGRERSLRRRPVRIRHAVRLAVRPRGRRRLCAAGRHLAGDEDRRHRRRPCADPGEMAPDRRASASWPWSACGRRLRSSASRSAGLRCRTSSGSGRCRCSPPSPP